MYNVYHAPQKRAEPWDLPLVLRCLTRHPFEPASTCDLRLLSWKTLFLVAITSGRWVSELAALDYRPPFLVFLPHSIRLSPNVEFLPKVVSEFHLNATSTIPDFFPNPVTPEEKLYHSLDVTDQLSSTSIGLASQTGTTLCLCHIWRAPREDLSLPRDFPGGLFKLSPCAILCPRFPSPFALQHTPRGL